MALDKLYPTSIYLGEVSLMQRGAEVFERPCRGEAASCPSLKTLPGFVVHKVHLCHLFRGTKERCELFSVSFVNVVNVMRY